MPKLRLHRGLSIDRPQPESRPLSTEPMITPGDIKLIKSMGCDHVKVLFTPSHFMTPGGGLNDGNLWYVQRTVDTVLSQGMPCVICIHPEASFKKKYLGDPEQFEIMLKFYQNCHGARKTGHVRAR